jgi:hypothetical protein
MRHYEESTTFAPIQMRSQETFNTNSVANFLSLPTVVNPSS